MICAISEDEFDGIIGGTDEATYAAIMCDSEAIHWLANGDHTAAGVVRRDRDGKQVSYSWGAYRDGECVASR